MGPRTKVMAISEEKKTVVDRHFYPPLNTRLGGDLMDTVETYINKSCEGRWVIWTYGQQTDKIICFQSILFTVNYSRLAKVI